MVQWIPRSHRHLSGGDMEKIRTDEIPQIAASILLRDGRTRIQNLLGGITAWKKAGYPLTS
jgi:hypothetical protein